MRIKVQTCIGGGICPSRPCDSRYPCFRPLVTETSEAMEALSIAYAQCREKLVAAEKEIAIKKRGIAWLNERIRSYRDERDQFRAQVRHLKTELKNNIPFKAEAERLDLEQKEARIAYLENELATVYTEEAKRLRTVFILGAEDLRELGELAVKIHKVYSEERLTSLSIVDLVDTLVRNYIKTMQKILSE